MIPLRDDNPTESPAIITVLLIVACTGVFLWQASHPLPVQQQIAFSLGFVPASLFSPELLPASAAPIPAEATVLSSMFLHGGLGHLLGNMLYLWIFGNNVEDAMGRVRFVVFYALCGVAAAMAQAMPNPDSTIPMIGASGAVSGVLGAYLLLHPRARVLVVVPLGFYLQTLYLPAMAVLGLWFALQMISSLVVPASEGGVAWFAHMGGFVAGMALIPLFKRRDVPLFQPPRHW